MNQPVQGAIVIPTKEWGGLVSQDQRQLRQSGILFRIYPRNDNQIATPAPNLLLGTVHFGSPQEQALDQVKLRRLLKGMRLLVAEVDEQQPWDPALERYRLLARDQTLAELIGAQGFAELRQRLPAVAPRRLLRLRPWVALALLEARGEIQTGQTLDSRLQQWARELQLPIRPLETLEQQLHALDCVPPQEQALVLRQRLAQPDLIQQQAERVLDHYRNGELSAWLADVQAASGLDTEAAALEERARHCLLDMRNQRWMQQLSDILPKGGVLVAVGALHLAGDNGLLALLERQGYRIVAESQAIRPEPIPSPP
ncbi:TraB/GumN family protein [Azotobacter chroococcum]|uniref:TraB/GumN family protein n=1 Tax=Azotobacter chroococcum TaxID=353 RepID=UPI00146AAA02|nr:TraB/GumN family protein [Azotobacter chroococcum]